MFARHVTYHAEPGHRETIIGYIEGLLPEIRKMPGYIDILMLVDEAANEYVGVSTWATRQDAEDVTTTLMPQIMARLAAVLDAAPIVRIYEVHEARV